MKKGTCMLTDDAISGDRNVIKKEVGMVNFSPCNRYTAHVECKAKVTPVIMGATGTIRKSFTKYLMNERNQEL
jgi:hypothetical protein